METRMANELNDDDDPVQDLIDQILGVFYGDREVKGANLGDLIFDLLTDYDGAELIAWCNSHHCSDLLLEDAVLHLEGEISEARFQEISRVESTATLSDQELDLAKRLYCEYEMSSGHQRAVDFFKRTDRKERVLFLSAERDEDGNYRNLTDPVDSIEHLSIPQSGWDGDTLYDVGWAGRP
jgi:hypothetical protein